MTTSLKRFIVALAFVLPTAVLVSSPVLAAAKTKTHHRAAIHHVSHKTHAKKAVTPTAS